MNELGSKQTMLMNRITFSLKPLDLFSEIGYVAEGVAFKIIIRPMYIFKDMIKEGEDLATYVFEADMLSEDDIGSEKVVDQYANEVIKSVLQMYLFGGREVVYGTATA